VRTITYRTTYQTIRGTHHQDFVVRARNVNAGLRKALTRALKDLPQGWELARIEFWEAL